MVSFVRAASVSVSSELLSQFSPCIDKIKTQSGAFVYSGVSDGELDQVGRK